jgi:hypothetical protein
MDFVLLFLVAYGITFGLMNRKLPGFSEWLIAKPWRMEGEEGDKTTFFGRMLVCPYCTGFHAGWLAWLLVRLPIYAERSFGSELLLLGILEAISAAFAASAFCYVIDTAAQWLEDSSAAAREDADE